MKRKKILFCIITGLFVVAFGFRGAHAQFWTQINVDGFGDVNNYNIFALCCFNNNLYASTNNNATGGEVWEYDGASWSQVNLDGFGDANNTIAARMAEFNNCLYVGTRNDSTGGQVWAFNGTTWRQVNSSGFGNNNNTAICDLTVYDGSLYAATKNEATGGEIWKYDGANWFQVSSNGFGDSHNNLAYRMQVNTNSLYVGTHNAVTGAQIWEYNGTSWSQSNAGGFGDTNNVLPGGLGIYNTRLCVSTGHTTVQSTGTGTEIWEYNGTSWTQINTDGFGDATNTTSYGMPVLNSRMYAGTYNESTGGEVWEYNGTSWVQTNADGFGDVNNTLAFSLCGFNGELYVGTYNEATGAEIWKLSNSQPGSDQYFVYGGESFSTTEPDWHEKGYHPELYGYKLLGSAKSAQAAKTFIGSHAYYIITVYPVNIAEIDTVQGSDSQYFGTNIGGNTIDSQNIGGQPDGLYAYVGGKQEGGSGGFTVINASSHSLSSITVYGRNSGYLYVSSDGNCGDYSQCYTKIQEAIDIATDGSVILVKQGTYEESLSIGDGKSILLKGGYDSVKYDNQIPNTTVVNAPGSTTIKPSNGSTLQFQMISVR